MYHTETPIYGNKVLTIGGGTGNSVILRGLKKYVKDITTIVTVADDGGGSGILRADLGMLPPGDIRACLLALANIEPTMEKLFNYRFKEGTNKGQSMGNLILAAMVDLYGNMDVAIKRLSEVLAIKGKVLPMTLDDVVLFAELEDHSIIEGESNITFLTRKTGGRIVRVFTKPEILKPLEEAIDEIMSAEIILLGPGSLYTSLMPNLLVKDIAEALQKTAAKIYYICNVMTQPGETDRYTVTDHVQAVTQHAGAKIIDTVVVNDEPIDPKVLIRYELLEHSMPIYLTERERERLEKEGYELILGNFADVKLDYIRHDADQIAVAVLENFNQ